MENSKAKDVMLKCFDKLCGNYTYQNREKIDLEDALWTAVQALEKEIPQNHFINECNCIVDYDMLYNSIDNKCKFLNCYLHNKYRIILSNSYPTVCINRKRYYVHILIGEYIYGRIRKGYVIHHKDKNKLNAMQENLELMSNKSI